MPRPVYVIYLRPEDETHGLRSIKAVLKSAWRQWGLRCTSIREVNGEDESMSDQQRMVKLCSLWQRESGKTGKTYYSGYWGKTQLLMFDKGEQPHPTREGETVRVWDLLIQEAAPDRRPQNR